MSGQNKIPEMPCWEIVLPAGSSGLAAAENYMRLINAQDDRSTTTASAADAATGANTMLD